MFNEIGEKLGSFGKNNIFCGDGGPIGLFKEHAQDGRGRERPVERVSRFFSSLAVRSRALCAWARGYRPADCCCVEVIG